MRKTLGVVAGMCAVVLLFAPLTRAHGEPEAGASTSVGTAETEIPAVFRVPPAAELAKIAQSELRLELLRMVHEDQLARSASK